MKKLLIGAWLVFALDLAILLLMVRVREHATAEFSDADREFAISVIWKFAAWLGAVGIVLVVAWWRDSRDRAVDRAGWRRVAAALGVDDGGAGDHRPQPAVAIGRPGW